MSRTIFEIKNRKEKVIGDPFHFGTLRYDMSKLGPLPGPYKDVEDGVEQSPLSIDAEEESRTMRDR